VEVWAACLEIDRPRALKALARLVAAVALALLFAAVLRFAASQVAAAAAAALLGWPAARLVEAALLASGGVIGLGVCAFAWSRLAVSGRVAAVAVAGALLFHGARYRDSLREGAVSPFAPGIVALTPDGTVDDDNPMRPRLRYRLNRWGFREPDFALAHPPTTLRGVVIGDSYVFGIGVPPDETLPVHLRAALAARHPGAAVEVINLGMPGDNVRAHVDLALAAEARLQPDFLVLALTLPNDLSAWDWPTEYRAAHRASLYSLARYLCGSQLASTLWGVRLLQSGATPPGIAAFSAEVDRLYRARGATPLPTVVLAYRFGAPWLDGAFANRPATRLLSEVGSDEDYLPGDGHPSAHGNRAFAARVADALYRIPDFAAALRQAAR